MWTLPILSLLACGGDHSYIVEGTVVEVHAPHEVVVDHKDIPGFMGAMVMPFSVDDPTLLDDLQPGSLIYGRLVVADNRATLTKIRVTGQGRVPQMRDDGPLPVRPGQLMPVLQVELEDGTVGLIGPGQAQSTALAFVYTRCPMPEYCPATIARLQALQAQIGPEQRILAITLDPEYDTADVLTAYGEKASADPTIWQFGRFTVEQTADLAIFAGMPVAKDESGTIVHALRFLILGKDGRLIERYDDNDWPLDRVVTQLKTGGPPAPKGTASTLSPKDEVAPE